MTSALGGVSIAPWVHVSTLGSWDDAISPRPLGLRCPHRSSLPPQVIVHLCLVSFFNPLLNFRVKQRDSLFMSGPHVALTLTNSSPCKTLTLMNLSPDWGLREYMWSKYIFLKLKWGLETLPATSWPARSKTWLNDLGCSQWLYLEVKGTLGQFG